jgi:hypothetical protein
MTPSFQEPEISFDWGPDGSSEKFFLFNNESSSPRITVHPGLSRAQVAQVADELGEYGPWVIKAWERHTGFTD